MYADVREHMVDVHGGEETAGFAQLERGGERWGGDRGEGGIVVNSGWERVSRGRKGLLDCLLACSQDHVAYSLTRISHRIARVTSPPFPSSDTSHRGSLKPSSSALPCLFRPDKTP